MRLSVPRPGDSKTQPTNALGVGDGLEVHPEQEGRFIATVQVLCPLTESSDQAYLARQQILLEPRKGHIQSIARLWFYLVIHYFTREDLSSLYSKLLVEQMHGGGTCPELCHIRELAVKVAWQAIALDLPASTLRKMHCDLEICFANSSINQCRAN